MSETKRYLITFKDGVSSDEIAAFRSGVAQNLLGESNGNVKEVSKLGIVKAELTSDQFNQLEGLKGDGSPIDSIG
ncbi:hypothetical protein HWV62_23246 [Athelia sp. TMB]|nr:hypothetical protein HWV62_23246 [Athelia sp. TMB]